MRTAGFAPNDPITREQMAAMMYRFVQAKGWDTTASADLSGYTDAPQISTYALPALQWANAEGIISGNGTLLSPDAPAPGHKPQRSSHAFAKSFPCNIYGAGETSGPAFYV